MVFRLQGPELFVDLLQFLKNGGIGIFAFSRRDSFRLRFRNGVDHDPDEKVQHCGTGLFSRTGASKRVKIHEKSLF